MLDRIIALWRMLIRLLRDKCGDMPVPDIRSIVSTQPSDLVPTQSQIDTLARCLLPAIEKFFSNERLQHEPTEQQQSTD